MRESGWSIAAVEDLRSSNLSIASLAKKYGRSDKAIRKLMKSENIVRLGMKPATGMKSYLEQDPLSSEHVRLGLFLLRLRGEEEKKSFADRFVTSAIALGKMESGLHDFTLRELQKIGELSGRPIHQLYLELREIEPLGRLH